MKRPVGIVVAALLVAGCGAVSPSKLDATPLISVPSVMLGSPDPVSPAPSATLPQGNPTETMVDVGGRSLSVSCAGESTPGKPTVVFEHGLEGRATHWSPIQSALSETVKACAYDRAGLGRSDSSARTRVWLA